jgi:hypothetical protein
MAIQYRMAITIKSTYSLDVESVRALEDLAGRWRVSKSEALRRTIRAAAAQSRPAANQRLAALDAAQKGLKLTGAAASRWERQLRAERYATGTRRRAK